ncbi:MAG TPA: hypothetical protein PLT03_07245, partial [Bacillota bacterium]|nr:hypothetical protein [Bacillota bacterium]
MSAQIKRIFATGLQERGALTKPNFRNRQEAPGVPAREAEKPKQGTKRRDRLKESDSTERKRMGTAGERQRPIVLKIDIWPATQTLHRRARCRTP